MLHELCFRLNDEIITLTDFGPTDTLLDFIRERKNLSGTKEGCNEGDCGACTIAMGELEDGELVYRPVNACIQLLGMAHGRHMITVDHLSKEGGALHPVQDAMARHHGSQCGFCTPGIVMSLYCLHEDRKDPPTRETVNTWLAGNLCRCTGYRPIIDAAMESCFGPIVPSNHPSGEMGAIDSSQSLFVGNDDAFFAAPATLKDALELYAKHPDSTPVAGATDVGLWVTKRLDELPKILHLGRIQGFSDIVVNTDGLTMGAGVTYEAALSHLADIDPDIAELILRIGSRQVRASGTIGGNIANGSPIGDTPPLLIVLEAAVELQSVDNKRSMPIEEFFIEYGKQDRNAGELLTSIQIPALQREEHLRCGKITKRFDQDISAVMAAFKFTLEGERIAAARIAYGGMAGTPKRANHAEQLLQGVSISDEVAWLPAITALSDDFAPMSDMRASASYRMTAAQNLLRKALLEIGGTSSSATRVTATRPDDLEAAE
ncbi:MAG: xanthine dehydrogenase small subunit [Alphaproteobacteria bacterium]|nr:xanthine dehydrogenase small subunit [Alphaproteobacteria bacterium]